MNKEIFIPPDRVWRLRCLLTLPWRMEAEGGGGVVARDRREPRYWWWQSSTTANCRLTSVLPFFPFIPCFPTPFRFLLFISLRSRGCCHFKMACQELQRGETLATLKKESDNLKKKLEVERGKLNDVERKCPELTENNEVLHNFHLTPRRLQKTLPKSQQLVFTIWNTC